MMPSPPIDDRSKTCNSRRLAIGSVQPCTDLRDCPAVAKQIRSGNMEPRPLTTIRTTKLPGSAIGSTASAKPPRPQHRS